MTSTFLSIILVLIHLNHQNSRLSHGFPYEFSVISGYHVVVGPQVDATLVVAMAFAIDVASLKILRWYKNVGKSWENMEKIIEMLEHDVKFLKTLLEFDKYWNMMIHDDQFFLLCAKTITKDVPKVL